MKAENGRLLPTLLVVMVLSGCKQATGLAPLVSDAPPIPLSEIRALTCELTGQHAAFLPADGEKAVVGDKITFVFTNLNSDRRTADVIGNASQEPVEYSVAMGQIIFIERTAGGSVNSTSIFVSEKTARMQAVHSRHVLIAPGSAVVSQYIGYCDPKR